MTETDFYQEVEHTPVPWRQYQLHAPMFYPDFSFISVSFLVPMDRAKAILPSKRLKPYRITPWHAAYTITAYQYQDSDIGPYNEVGMGVPVTMDKVTPIFTGSLRRMPVEPINYSHHLPVTTEIAREVGFEFAGYPKFIADIDFSDDGNWLSCELKTDGQSVLALSGKKLPLGRAPRFRVYPLTYRRGYLLRSEFIISARDMGASKNNGDVKLELGDHPIAGELRDLRLGKMLAYSYCPQAQGILTPVIESYAA